MPEILRRWEETTGDKTDDKQKLAFIAKCAKEMLENEKAEVIEEAKFFREHGELPSLPSESHEVQELQAKQT